MHVVVDSPFGRGVSLIPWSNRYGDARFRVLNEEDAV
ncbi:MAG: hypothetical protein JWP08_2205 [Bryobacterales bacterium]|nr:hypothetical protein [Bryobacterales bacterium]